MVPDRTTDQPVPFQHSNVVANGTVVHLEGLGELICVVGTRLKLLEDPGSTRPPAGARE